MLKKHSIRIHHECEGGIEKNDPRDHVSSSRNRLAGGGGVTNGDPEGRIFLSHPHTTN